MKLFTGVADFLEANGIPCAIRSAGGIATWHWTAAYPGITEIQAGSYVVMDNFHGKMVPGFEHSLTIQASVISRQSKQVIVDAGNKSVGRSLQRDHHRPRPARSSDPTKSTASSSAPDGSPLKVGDCVALVPGYSPSTVNFYDAFHVVQDDIVVDIWPVIPRGPGHHGLAAGSAARSSSHPPQWSLSHQTGPQRCEVVAVITATSSHRCGWTGWPSLLWGRPQRRQGTYGVSGTSGREDGAGTSTGENGRGSGERARRSGRARTSTVAVPRGAGQEKRVMLRILLVASSAATL